VPPPLSLRSHNCARSHALPHNLPAPRPSLDVPEPCRPSHALILALSNPLSLARAPQHAKKIAHQICRAPRHRTKPSLPLFFVLVSSRTYPRSPRPSLVRFDAL
jgi:hypothetical protein